MYLQKVISRKTFFTNLFFVGILKVKDESSRIRIHYSEAWIRGSGSGSTPKCHGSGTLLKMYCYVLGSTMLGSGARCRRNQGSYQPLMFTFSGAACSNHGLRKQQKTMLFAVVSINYTLRSPSLAKRATIIVPFPLYLSFFSICDR